jgi:hypothetical protein
MINARKGFPRLKAYKQLAALRIALKTHYERYLNNRILIIKPRPPHKFTTAL